MHEEWYREREAADDKAGQGMTQRVGGHAEGDEQPGEDTEHACDDEPPTNGEHAPQGTRAALASAGSGWERLEVRLLLGLAGAWVCHRLVEPTAASPSRLEP
ncbi:hypothetical protein GCM10009826_21110 [Humibacillus xanthopallidus]